MVWRGAISGFGEVAARAHLPGWRAQPGVNIVAIHDPVAARRHEALNLLKGVRVYDDLELMLDGEALDFVDIASPPVFHAATVRLALQSKVNVLVEKPLCLDAEELSELTALAAAQGRLMACVHNWKYAPAYRRAHELISSGRLGQIQHLSLLRTRNGPAGAIDAGRWRLEPKFGGGIVIDHGWHAFYLAHWLMGGETPVKVSGSLGLSPVFAVDDLADLQIEFPHGRIAHIHLSWRAPVRRTTAMMYGAGAMLQIDGERLVLTAASGSVESYCPDTAPEDSYHAAWFEGVAAGFIQALGEGPDCQLARANLRETQIALGLTAAVRKMAETGQVVKLHWPD